MLVRDAIAMFSGSGLEALGPTTWADLGSGDGTFTVALANLLAAGSLIHAMDRDRTSLKRMPPSHRQGVRIETHVGDFTKQPWPFSDLDGVLMANSLHFVEDKARFVRACESQMKAPHRFLIVEYDTDKGNPWVPYPVSRSRLEDLFAAYSSIQWLGSKASRYQRARIYAALVSS